jgi:tetratricopeptide (TPR) repeat protein
VAIGLKKTYAAPYYNMALLLEPMGRTQEAIDNYLLAIQWDPGNAMSYNNLAVICAKRSNFRQAVELLSSAISLDNNLFEAYRNRGCAYACLHQNGRALNDAASLDKLGDRKDGDIVRNAVKQNG